jgi:hypothetical protein
MALHVLFMVHSANTSYSHGHLQINSCGLSSLLCLPTRLKNHLERFGIKGMIAQCIKGCAPFSTFSSDIFLQNDKNVNGFLFDSEFTL